MGRHSSAENHSPPRTPGAPDELPDVHGFILCVKVLSDSCIHIAFDLPQVVGQQIPVSGAENGFQDGYF